jgi:hypothetical protein
MAKLVTVATDGFRDYITLPDGREINLGSVSVLKLVSTLVHGVNRCRRALDTFLKNRQTIISVDLEELEALLKPKRSRWACHDDLFISIVSRQPFRGSGMTQETTQAEAIKQQIAEIEEHIKLLEQTAKEHAAGSLSEEQVQGAIDSLSKMVTELGQKPGGQSNNRYFYAAIDELSKMLDAFEKEPTVATEADVVGLQTVTASLLESVLGKTAAAIDEDLEEELFLHIQNEGRLYQDRMVIVRNMINRIEQGSYNKAAVVRLWLHFINTEVVPKYMREFKIKEPDDKYIPTALRKSLASRIEEHEKGRIDFGDYDHLKTAGELPPALKKYNEEHDKGESKGEQQDKEAGELPPALKKYNEEHGKGESKDDEQQGKEAGELPPALKKYNEEHGKGESKDDGQQQDKEAGELPPALKKYNEEHGKGEGKKDDAKGDGKDKKDLPPWLQKGKDKDASSESNATNSTYYKLAAQDVPIINEALANSVMTKIESALGVVEASNKNNTHVAKGDLDRISSMLSSLITGADLSDPSLCAALKELSVMTDKINSHFS